MANWTATLTGAAKSADGANAVITITLINSVTSESQTRTLTIAQNYSANWFKGQCEQMIASLDARDAVLAMAQAAITAGGNSVILATG